MLSPSFECLKERAARAVLHQNEGFELIGGGGGRGAAGLDDGVVEADDVGMLEGLNEADLLVDLLLC